MKITHQHVISMLLLCLIVIFAFAIRWWRIDTLVPILNRDEAALAFTAYMLKEAGVDEWGRGWSLTQESFGDYKLVGYPTLLVALFSAFPYQDWVVRLPSAAAGALLVLPMYLWSFWLTRSRHWSLLSAFLIAISPVFGHFSRFAYEANVALLLVVSSLLLLLYKFKNPRYQTLATIVGILLYSLSITVYNTPLLYLPFVLVVYVLAKGLLLPKRWVLGASLLTLVGLFFLISFQSLFSQKSGISIFTDETLLIETYPAYINSLPNQLRFLLDSQYLFFLVQIVQRFVLSFSPNFLSISGGQHPWHSLANYAHLTWVVYLLAMGWIISYLLRITQRLIQSHKQVLSTLLDGSAYTPHLLTFLLLVMSLIPASITVDAPHATRSLLFFFLLTLMAVLMMQSIFAFLQNRFRAITPGILIVLISVLLLEHLSYWKFYFQLYPLQQQTLYYPGFQEIIKKAESDYPTQPIAVVDPSNGFQYILLAWYLLPSPQEYLATQVRQLPDSIGFRYGEQVGRYHFISSSQDRTESEKVLIAWDHDSLNWKLTTF